MFKKNKPVVIDHDNRGTTNPQVILGPMLPAQIPTEIPTNVARSDWNTTAATYGGGSISTNTTKSKHARNKPPPRQGTPFRQNNPPVPQPRHVQAPNRHARFETSSFVIQAPYDQWEEFIHPNGSLYWTNSTQTVRVVSDIKPPLSKIQPNASATITRLMHALVEIPQISDYQNWEIYTDGRSCVYIDHGSRAASDTAQSLEEFKDQIKKLRGRMDIATKLRFEAAYWTFMQSHPNHRDLPKGALDDATEAIVWCHADRVLFKASNAPFSKEDAQEMTDLIKTISDLKRPTLKTWYCAAVMRAISQDRLASHYGQNDAREVRRKERADDISSPLPFKSNWDWLVWHLVASMSLGSPFGYLKRINNVDRTTTGDGVNTIRWRAFLKSLCKEWTDTNLLATVLVSATVALLAIPGLSALAQIAGIISVLCAISSVMCGMLLIFNHQDRVETSGGAGITYFNQVKLRGTGTTRPLALILGLPLSLMLWGMFWFIFAIVSCAYTSGLPGISQEYSIATRYVSLGFTLVLAIVGIGVVYFFYGVWRLPAARLAKLQSAPILPVGTAINMVTAQGGNPLMQLSGDQRIEPRSEMSELQPVQAGRPPKGVYVITQPQPQPQPYGLAYYPQAELPSERSQAEPVVHHPARY